MLVYDDEFPFDGPSDLDLSRTYFCSTCGNVICCSDAIMDKDYLLWGKRAFLFSHVMNIVEGPKEKRRLITGTYLVADIYCSDCKEHIGWKYYETKQEFYKYKEGKFVISKSKIDLQNFL